MKRIANAKKYKSEANYDRQTLSTTVLQNFQHCPPPRWTAEPTVLHCPPKHSATVLCGSAEYSEYSLSIWITNIKTWCSKPPKSHQLKVFGLFWQQKVIPLSWGAATVIITVGRATKTADVAASKSSVETTRWWASHLNLNFHSQEEALCSIQISYYWRANHIIVFICSLCGLAMALKKKKNHPGGWLHFVFILKISKIHPGVSTCTLFLHPGGDSSVVFLLVVTAKFEL